MPQHLARFTRTRKLSHGSQGPMYLADGPSGEQVIVQAIPPQKLPPGEGWRSLERELRILEGLRLPNVALFSEMQIGDDGTLYLIRPRRPGETLAERMRRQGRPPAEFGLELCEQVAKVLAAIHKKGIYHHHIRPDKIFLEQGRDGDIVRVLDLGMSRMVQRFWTMLATAAQLVGQAQVRGSIDQIRYAAPEQLTNPRSADARTDVYALGELLFEVLCGRPPLLGSDPKALLDRQARQRLPTLFEAAPDRVFSPELEAFVASLLSELPAGRPRDAAEVAARLAQLRQSGDLVVELAEAEALDSWKLTRPAAGTGTRLVMVGPGEAPRRATGPQQPVQPPPPTRRTLRRRPPLPEHVDVIGRPGSIHPLPGAEESAQASTRARRSAVVHLSPVAPTASIANIVERPEPSVVQPPPASSSTSAGRLEPPPLQMRAPSAPPPLFEPLPPVQDLEDLLRPAPEAAEEQTEGEPTAPSARSPRRLRALVWHGLGLLGVGAALAGAAALALTVLVEETPEVRRPRPAMKPPTTAARGVARGTAASSRIPPPTAAPAPMAALGATAPVAPSSAAVPPREPSVQPPPPAAAPRPAPPAAQIVAAPTTTPVPATPPDGVASRPALGPAPAALPSPRPRARAVALAVRAPAAAPPARLVTIRINSLPAGAHVLRTGQVVGTTPFSEVVDSKTVPMRYQVSRPGYRPVQVESMADRSRDMQIDLEPIMQGARVGGPM